MAFAHVYVDRFFKPPTDAQAYCCQILGTSNKDASEFDSLPDAVKEEIKAIAEDYQRRCQGLTETCKGEAEWKSLLLEGPVRRLEELLGCGRLMTSASEKPWLAAFKPRPPPIRELFASTTPSLLASDSQLLLQSAPILSKSPPPTETSETTTAASLLEDDSADALKNSKPDISIGFDRDGFSELHRRLLAELQYEGQLLSEPHAPQLGLHFPFLIVEAKGLTTSGSMIGAENQAAVAGACAINILHALAGLASDPSLDNTAALEPPCVIFSIATEGPNHELCFHFRTKGEYHMTVHRIWRPTLQQDCEEFIFALARIMYWGAEVLNKAIVASLNRAVERIYG